MELPFLLTLNWWVTPSLHLLSTCFLVFTLLSLYFLTYFFVCLFQNWTFFGTQLIGKMEKGVCNTKTKTLWSSKEGFLWWAAGAHPHAPFPMQTKDELPADSEISLTSSDFTRLESVQCPQRAARRRVPSSSHGSALFCGTLEKAQKWPLNPRYIHQTSFSLSNFSATQH